MSSAPCPFCAAFDHPDELLTVSGDVAVIPDGYPLGDGHVLVVPRCHEPDLLSLDPDTAALCWEIALAHARSARSADASIEGFNIGVNIGTAAGQTVGHVHIHVVPRRSGDTPDPRGGVRWVIPDRAQYWAS